MLSTLLRWNLALYCLTGTLLYSAGMRLVISLAALLTLALSGCASVCDQMCDAQADMIDRCLGTWETTWEDLSYAGHDDFTERCYAVYGDAFDGLDEGSTEAIVLEDRCTQDLQAAASDIDCESLVSIDP